MTLSQAALFGYPTVPTGFDEKTKSDPNHSHCTVSLWFFFMLCEVEQLTISSQVNHEPAGWFFFML
jgi:hypothetical protein